MKSDKQEQDGESPDTLHCEFGPHGDGMQGFSGTCCTGLSAVEEEKNNERILIDDATMNLLIKNKYNIDESALSYVWDDI